MMSIADVNKTVIGSFQKFFEINHNLSLSLTQQQLDIANICVESSIKQTQVLSAEVKPAQEVFNVQSRLAQEFNKKLLNNSRVTLEILADAKKQWSHWAESTLKQTQELNPLFAGKNV